MKESIKQLLMTMIIFIIYMCTNYIISYGAFLDFRIVIWGFVASCLMKLVNFNIRKKLFLSNTLRLVFIGIILFQFVHILLQMRKNIGEAGFGCFELICIFLMLIFEISFAFISIRKYICCNGNSV